MSHTIIQVDAFADRPFKGNPAAVCVMAAAADADWMQAVATEMNLSETAFLYPTEEGYSLRWFTPTAEVDLCGHATLASAHTLWSEGHVPPERELRFTTRSGLLTATQADGWITLDFPSDAPQPITAPPELLKSLRGAQPVAVAESREMYLVELESPGHLRSLQPDFALMRTLPMMGVIVTSVGEEGFDFISRFFAPAVGINEDPVTGAAHCVLTPYWGQKLQQSEFSAYQASARGGVLQLQLRGERVCIRGQAVTVMRAELLA